MEFLNQIAEDWLYIFGLHQIELSILILLTWALDRWIDLDARIRYWMWIPTQLKALIPPFFILRLPPRLHSETTEEFAAVLLGEPVAAIAVAAEKFSLAAALFLLWLFSALVIGVFIVLRNVSFRRKPGVMRLLKLDRPQPGLNAVQIHSHSGITSPVFTGLFKPALYLPEAWSTWPKRKVDCVLVHEMEHYRGKHIWMLLLQNISLALLWPNPLVWMARTMVNRLQELRCDGRVLEYTGMSPVEYGRMLWEFLDLQARRFTFSGIQFVRDPNSLKWRFEELLNFQEAAMKRKRWNMVLPVLVGIAVLPLSILNVVGDDFMEMADVDVKPQIISESVGQYPEDAKRKGIEGKVFVRFLIGEDGLISSVSVLRGPDIFRSSAIDATRSMKFSPAIHEGKAVPVWATMPFTFSLGRKESGNVLPAEPTPDLASEPDWNEGPITEFSNAEEKPALVHSVLPEYPEGARKAGLQGKVFVKYLVHKDGSVSHPHVLKGPEAFRGAAKEAVRQFRFEPARQDGKPIPVWIVEPVVFRIH